jgi:hypothetical protein
MRAQLDSSAQYFWNKDLLVLSRYPPVRTIVANSYERVLDLLQKQQTTAAQTAVD